MAANKVLKIFAHSLLVEMTIACDEITKNAQFQNVTVIIFDVGKSAAERISNDGPTFFEEARNCIGKIIIRSVMQLYGLMIGKLSESSDFFSDIHEAKR